MLDVTSPHFSHIFLLRKTRFPDSCRNLLSWMYCICLRRACVLCVFWLARWDLHSGGRGQVCSCLPWAVCLFLLSWNDIQNKMDAMNKQSKQDGDINPPHPTLPIEYSTTRLIRQEAIDWSSGALWCDGVQQQWAVSHSWRWTGIQTLSDISTNT